MKRLIVLGSVLLAGCSVFQSPDGIFHDRSEDYIDATPQPELKFAGPTRPASSRYDVPASQETIEKPLVDPRPPAFDEDMEKYKKNG